MTTFGKIRQLIHKNRPYIARELRTDEYSSSRSRHSREKDTVKDALRCNMCGRILTEYDIQENFGFDYHVGYGSRHDLEIIKARFCCDCFDDLLDSLIQKCKINPVVGEYDLASDEDLLAREPEETQ